MSLPTPSTGVHDLCGPEMGRQSGVVAFTKDWDDVPTCTTHVLREMGRHRPVLWVNSIGTRKPGLSVQKDWRRVGRRIRGAFKRAEHKENQVRVLTPLLVPKAESAFGRSVNRCLMRRYVRRETGNLDVDHIEYWCFVPNAVDLLPPRRQDNRVVYYVVDDWSQFHNLDGKWLAGKEEALLARADVVFAASRVLVEKCSAKAGEVHYAPHGVEHGTFAAALERSTAVPAELEAMQKPVVGFYGNLHSWVDFGLVGRLAALRPDWSFVMIGQVYSDVTALERVGNVHLLGRREHGALPAYCRGFDAAMIPYDVTHPRMQSVSPVKTCELLAAGVPIVAADIPELRRCGDAVLLAHTDDEWITMLEAQITRQDRALVSAGVAQDDWVGRVKKLRQVVDAAWSGEEAQGVQDGPVKT